MLNLCVIEHCMVAIPIPHSNPVTLPAGKTETLLEMLRSTLAQLHYRYEIMEWERKGVPFRSHIYVPEVHPVTGLPFHEREDEAHVFKVLLKQTSAMFD